MQLSISRKNANVHVEISGAIKNRDEISLKHEFAKINMEPHKKVILDLTSVPAISSLGISRIFLLYKEQKKQGGEVIIQGIHKNLYKQFISFGLDRHIKIEDKEN